MDQAWFMCLNGLPASATLLGKLAIVVSTYGIVLYPLLLLGLWSRGSGDPDTRRRILLLSVIAAVFALGVNAVLNVVLPRPRPFLVLPAHVLVASRQADAPGCVTKKTLRPAVRRDVIHRATEIYRVSERRACRTFGWPFGRSTSSIALSASRGSTSGAGTRQQLGSAMAIFAP